MWPNTSVMVFWRILAIPWRMKTMIDLRLALRDALYPLGELGQILISLQEAYTVAEALGDQYRLGRVSAVLTAHFG
jgi:hypothetical protein